MRKKQRNIEGSIRMVPSNVALWRREDEKKKEDEERRVQRDGGTYPCFHTGGTSDAR